MRLSAGHRSAFVPGLARTGAVVAAVVVGSLLAQGLQDPQRSLDLLGLALAGGAGLAVSGATRRPVPALAVVTGLTAGYLALGHPYGPVQLCLVAAVLVVASRCAVRTSARASALAAVVTAAAVYPRMLADGHLLPAVAAALWALGWLLAPWSVGVLRRSWSAAARLREERLIAEALSADRIRVARDVHDAAGHGFAVIALQADVALLTLDEQPAQARASLEAIRAASSHALADLRTTLESLGATAPGTGGGLPTPTGSAAAPAVAGRPAGLRPPAGTPRPHDLSGRLHDLAVRLRSAGMEVDLRVDPGLSSADPARLAPETADAVYRVVQESLTNVVHHAGGAAARVVVRVGPDDLMVTVTDDGAATRPPAASAARRRHGPGTAGHGITGMSERLRLLGGALDAGPRPERGFSVTATVPLSADTPSADTPSADTPSAGTASVDTPSDDPVSSTAERTR